MFRDNTITLQCYVCSFFIGLYIVGMYVVCKFYVDFLQVDCLDCRFWTECLALQFYRQAMDLVAIFVYSRTSDAISIAYFIWFFILKVKKYTSYNIKNTKMSCNIR